MACKQWGSEIDLLDGCTSVLAFQALWYYNFHTVFLFLFVKQYRYKRGDKYINTHRQKEKQRVGTTLFPPV